MPKIHTLSYHEAQKIAAGEVVERPANVVKELIENSLDAGATTISVFVEDGGKKLIRVVDNGCGMAAEDARLCFEHHATSKITSVDDLVSLATFGFRGEALSSIASVSRVTLYTNEDSAHAGSKLVKEGNVLVEEQAVATPRGTDFSVENLFYNVPARLKFLKKRETEFNQIHTLFQAYSLAYPQLHWQFSSEGSVVHICPPAENLEQRVAQLFDQRLIQALISCSQTTKDGDIQINGVITDNTYARYDRSDIFFFVNQRWIKNQSLARALLKGYANTLPPGRFPAAVLFITVPQAAVDINVHPRKEEVLFLHPKVIENTLYTLVGTALERGLSQRLEKTSREMTTTAYTSSYPKTAYNTSLYHDAASTYVQKSGDAFSVPSFSSKNSTALFFGTQKTQTTSLGVATIKSTPPNTQATQQTLFTHAVLSEQLTNELPQATQPSAEQNTSNQELAGKQNIQQAFAEQSATEQSATEQYVTERHAIVGYLHKTYILLEHPDGLYIVDQHAAHERIIYERLAQRFEDAATIQLLFPLVISLGAEQVENLLPYLPLLHQLGIDIEQLSPSELVIKATPVQAQAVDYTELLRTMLGWIYENNHLETTEISRFINEKLRAQIACKAAVKAGDELTREQMEQLLTDLATTPHRFSCPHGRPTGWLLGSYEIEKRFRRKQ